MRWETKGVRWDETYGLSSAFVLQSGMGDGDYLAVFHHLLLPVAYEVSLLC